LKIGLMPAREELYRRIEARTETMLRSGWVEEVCGLLAAGIAEDAKIFDFIGYREMLEVARGEMKVDAARAAIVTATRHYAKRQMTWFRRDSAIQWFAGAGDDPGVQDEVEEWMRGKLGDA
jgi:tRNA dimethylallyltransferase